MRRRTVLYSRSPGTPGELEQDLQVRAEASGDCVVGIIGDHDAPDRRRGSRTAWKALLANLDGVDQIAMASAGDIPCKAVADLLRLLATLRDHGVGLKLLAEDIDTATGPASVMLEIIEAFRRAKLSQAIRNGQARAVAAGKVIGRPAIPRGLVACIQACLAKGAGIRPLAKKFGVSPGSIINIRRSMTQISAEAA